MHFNYHEPVEVENQTNQRVWFQLYVISNQNREFYGPQLSQSLENLGFIFGERQMYHRHFDLSVASRCYLAWQTLNNQVRLIITIWPSFQPWVWYSLCSCHLQVIIWRTYV